MDNNQAVMAPAEVGKAEKRTPRSIRFYDPEWERIEGFAEKRSMAAAEFVRFAALHAIEGGASADQDGDRLAPLIERTFRYSYMMATKMRDDMQADHLHWLSRQMFADRFGLDARALQDWEQGRRVPDRTARVLLTVIDSDPEAVVRALGK